MKCKLLYLILIILSLTPFVVASQKYSDDVLTIEEYFDVYEDDTLRYTFKVSGIFLEPQPKFAMNISNLPFYIHSSDVEEVNCNGELLNPYPKGILKDKELKVELRVTDDNFTAIPIEENEWKGYIVYEGEKESSVYVNYDPSGKNTDYRCKLIILVREAQKSNFIGVCDGGYQFKVRPWILGARSDKVESVSVYVKIPDGYNISDFEPKNTAKRDTSNLVQWKFEKPISPLISEIVVNYTKKEPIQHSTPPPETDGWFSRKGIMEDVRGTFVFLIVVAILGYIWKRDFINRQMKKINLFKKEEKE